MPPVLAETLEQCLSRLATAATGSRHVLASNFLCQNGLNTDDVLAILQKFKSADVVYKEALVKTFLQNNVISKDDFVRILKDIFPVTRLEDSEIQRIRCRIVKQYFAKNQSNLEGFFYVAAKAFIAAPSRMSSIFSLLSRARGSVAPAQPRFEVLDEVFMINNSHLQEMICGYIEGSKIAVSEMNEIIEYVDARNKKLTDEKKKCLPQNDHLMRWPLLDVGAIYQEFIKHSKDLSAEEFRKILERPDISRRRLGIIKEFVEKKLVSSDGKIDLDTILKALKESKAPISSSDMLVRGRPLESLLSSDRVFRTRESYAAALIWGCRNMEPDVFNRGYQKPYNGRMLEKFLEDFPVHSKEDKLQFLKLLRSLKINKQLYESDQAKQILKDLAKEMEWEDLVRTLDNSVQIDDFVDVAEAFISTKKEVPVGGFRRILRYLDRLNDEGRQPDPMLKTTVERLLRMSPCQFEDNVLMAIEFGRDNVRELLHVALDSKSQEISFDRFNKMLDIINERPCLPELAKSSQIFLFQAVTILSDKFCAENQLTLPQLRQIIDKINDQEGRDSIIFSFIKKNALTISREEFISILREASEINRSKICKEFLSSGVVKSVEDLLQIMDSGQIKDNLGELFGLFCEKHEGQLSMDVIIDIIRRIAATERANRINSVRVFIESCDMVSGVNVDSGRRVAKYLISLGYFGQEEVDELVRKLIIAGAGSIAVKDFDDVMRGHFSGRSTKQEQLFVREFLVKKFLSQECDESLMDKIIHHCSSRFSGLDKFGVFRSFFASIDRVNRKDLEKILQMLSDDRRILPDDNLKMQSALYAACLSKIGADELAYVLNSRHSSPDDKIKAIGGMIWSYRANLLEALSRDSKSRDAAVIELPVFLKSLSEMLRAIGDIKIAREVVIRLRNIMPRFEVAEVMIILKDLPLDEKYSGIVELFRDISIFRVLTPEGLSVLERKFSHDKTSGDHRDYSLIDIFSYYEFNNDIKSFIELFNHDFREEIEGRYNFFHGPLFLGSQYTGSALPMVNGLAQYLRRAKFSVPQLSDRDKKHYDLPLNQQSIAPSTYEYVKPGPEDKEGYVKPDKVLTCKEVKDKFRELLNDRRAVSDVAAQEDLIDFFDCFYFKDVEVLEEGGVSVLSVGNSPFRRGFEVKPTEERLFSGFINKRVFLEFFRGNIDILAYLFIQPGGLEHFITELNLSLKDGCTANISNKVAMAVNATLFSTKDLCLCNCFNNILFEFSVTHSDALGGIADPFNHAVINALTLDVDALFALVGEKGLVEENIKCEAIAALCPVGHFGEVLFRDLKCQQGLLKLARGDERKRVESEIKKINAKISENIVMPFYDKLSKSCEDKDIDLPDKKIQAVIAFYICEELFAKEDFASKPSVVRLTERGNFLRDSLRNVLVEACEEAAGHPTGAAQNAQESLLQAQVAGRVNLG